MKVTWRSSLSKSMREKLGLRDADEIRIKDFVERYGAALLGPGGKGGSGVVVSSPGAGQRPAVLTAKHVLFNLSFAGEMTLLPIAMEGRRSVEPVSVWADNRLDIGLAQLPDDCAGVPVLELEKWESGKRVVLAEKQILVAAGFPAEWMEVDVQTRTIRSGLLLYYTQVEKVMPRNRSVVLDVNELEGALPHSLAGMSGGPVLTSDGSIVAINVAEARARNGRVSQLTVLRLRELSALRELVIGRDFVLQSESSISFRVVHRSGGKATNGSVTARVVLCAPNAAAGGRDAIVRSVYFQRSKNAPQLKIGIESVFPIAAADPSENDVAVATRAEIAKILEASDFSLE